MLDAAGIDRAAMVGYSDGARVVYALAARHPERVAAVVGIGGVSLPTDTNDWRRELAAAVRQNGIRASIEEMSNSESEPAPGWLIENLSATSTEMFALELEGWADAPTECADFPRIEAPTLIVCAEQYTANGSAQLAVAALSTGESAAMRGLGHLQEFWRTDLTAPIISDFLSRHAPVLASRKV